METPNDPNEKQYPMAFQLLAFLVLLLIVFLVGLSAGITVHCDCVPEHIQQRSKQE